MQLAFFCPGGCRWLPVPPLLPRSKVSSPLGSRRCCKSQLLASLASIADLFLDDWKNEAEHCWGTDLDGQVSGRIANMIPEGLHYDDKLRNYYERDESPLPAEDRPWDSFSEEERAGRGDLKLTNLEEIDNFQLSMEFFERSAPASRQGGILLDLGCGDAIMARRFAQSNKFDIVFAMDIMWSCLEVARHRAEIEFTGPADGLLMLRGDAQSMPFRDGQVDFVWWGLGVHMVENPQTAMQRAFACLRPGGRLMATTRPFMFLPREMKRYARLAGFEDIDAVLLADGTPQVRVILRAVRPLD